MDRLMQNWFLLRTTPQAYEAEIIKGMLEDNQIPVIVVNRQDSSYVFLGEIEVYVPIHFKDMANDLLNGAVTN
jgi:Putative prokaryotic signal transducing protein